MTPLMFGSSSRRLFGIYEPGTGSARQTTAAVICAPWGEEYLHAHRSLRYLARRLVQQGVHTLRFDYFGTGDSGGDIADASLRGAEDDVLTAVAELKAIAGVDTVALIGMRLGANLSMTAAVRSAADIASVALWDPVIDSAAYFDERRRAVVHPKRFESIECYDFGLTPAVVDEISSLPTLSTLSTLPIRALIVCTADDPIRLSERFSMPPLTQIEYIPSEPAWIEDWPRSIIPVQVLRRIVAWVG